MTTHRSTQLAAGRRCSHCQTEFRPHEGGACAACGRPLCRVHGGARDAAVRCPACERAAQASGISHRHLPEAA